MTDPHDSSQRALLEELAVLRRRVADLERHEDFLRAVVENAPEFVSTIEPDGTMVSINRIVPGLGLDDVAGTSVFDYIEPEYHASVRACFERVLRTGEPDAYEIRGLAAHRAVAHYHTRVAPVKRGGRVVALTLLATDVTRLKHADLALHASEEKLRVAVAATGMGLWSWDAIKDEVVWDDVVTDLFGLAEGQAPQTYAEWFDLIHPADRARVAAAMDRSRRSGTFEDFEHRSRAAGERPRWVLCKGTLVHDADGRLVKVLGGCFDVTDRRELEEQLRQSQKMEAVGQLTAGIAHNFNNMLTVILPNLELCARSADGEMARRLHDARDGALRAASVVRQLMAFAGKGKPAERRPEDVAGLVRRTAQICAETFEREIAVEVECRAELPPLAVDASQIEQALLNLCLNARDAMRASGRGSHTLRLELDVVAPEVEGVAGRPGARPVPHARVRISDTGCGMDDETRRRAFEPFFTTKDVGEGTGLGLPVSYASLRAHDGWIDCESRPGEGTTFAVYLPFPEARRSREPAAAPAPGPRGHETILLVDDEDLVRRAVGRVLRSAGYEIVQASSGAEALAALGETGAGVDLVLLDVSMPRMSGPAVLEQIRARAPRLKVAFFSGMDAPPSAALRVSGVIRKPIEGDALLASVRGILDGG